MVHFALLTVLYAANALWFYAAFFQFSFRPKQAMLSGSRRVDSPDPKVKSTPEGDLWHHDLLAYLGGINLALAGLAVIRIAVLAAPNTPMLFAFTTGSHVTDRPLDVLSLTIVGLGHYSQAQVNLCGVRNTGRWIMGEAFDMITLIDGLLAILDWVAAVAVARSA